MRRRATWAASAIILASVVLIAPAGAAGDDDPTDADAGGGPEQGVTYSGRVDGFRVSLRALAPVTGGGTQVLVRLRLGCGNGRGPATVDERLPGVVAPDGSYSIDRRISEDGGGTREVEMHVEGRFTDPSSTTASYSYDLFDEDDDGNTESCRDHGELRLDGGRVAAGLERVEAAIPVEVDPVPDGGPIVASPDAVFAALGETVSDGADASEVFRIDPATNAVVAHRTVSIDLDALVVAGSTLYGIDADQGTLVPVETTSLTPGTPIPIAPPRTPDDEDLALYPAAALADGSLWLSATRDQQLVRVDPASGTVSARIPIDAHPAEIVAGTNGLYVETQTTPIFQLASGKRTVTNVIRSLDPGTGATVATSRAYPDGSIGAVVATADGVVFDAAGLVSAPDRLVSLDPRTLRVDATAKLQSPIAAAPPSVWTLAAGPTLRALRADLTRALDVPDVVTSTSDAGTGFGAIWVYNATQQSIYRVSTS